MFIPSHGESLLAVIYFKTDCFCRCLVDMSGEVIDECVDVFGWYRFHRFHFVLVHWPVGIFYVPFSIVGSFFLLASLSVLSVWGSGRFHGGLLMCPM